MKRILLILALVFSLSVNAQKAIELADLLQAMIPDVGIPKWPVAGQQSPITWKPATIKGNSKSQKGKVQLSMSGKKLVLNDKYVFENVSLSGNKESVTQISFETTVDYWSDVTEQIKAYFKTKKITITPIREDNQGFSIEGEYELKMPGKPIVWIKTSEFNNKEEMNTYFSMKLFFTKADFQKAN